jgi:coenzyme F420 biosynthesis associated uncharacterized protein
VRVDWSLAARIARRAAGEQRHSPAPADLAARADVARERVVAATGLVPTRPVPVVEWVDRGTWIDANLATMRSTLAPVLEADEPAGSAARPEPPSGLQAAGAAAVAAEVGGLLGLFSRRVLGQYDLDLLDPRAAPRLLLVGPNLDHAAGELGADRDELVTWVTLHEVTHAVQFGAVDWLRPQLGDTLRELIAALDVRPDPRTLLRLRLDDVRRIGAAVRRDGALAAALGPQRRGLLDRVQGTMGLVEGHAEWAMDRAGDDVLADVPALRAALDRRRETRAPLLRILDRLLGFDLKLRQYADGRRFCDAVVAARGEDGLRDAWSSPALTPTPAELTAPERWLERTAPTAD